MASLLGTIFPQISLADPMTGGNVPFEDCAPPCVTCCYDPPPRCPWYFQADALALRRDPQRVTPFATLGVGTPATDPTNVVLSTWDLERDFRRHQFLFGHNFEDTAISVEGSYFKIDDWNPSAEVRRPYRNRDRRESLFALWQFWATDGNAI